eukprot:757834-Hanusia_phi.AAC.2
MREAEQNRTGEDINVISLLASSCHSSPSCALKVQRVVELQQEEKTCSNFSCREFQSINVNVRQQDEVVVEQEAREAG